MSESTRSDPIIQMAGAGVDYYGIPCDQLPAWLLGRRQLEKSKDRRREVTHEDAYSLLTAFRGG